MADYNVAFKYNKRIITDDAQYPWPLNWGKYNLDRKMLNEDLDNGGLVHRSREAAAQQLTDPLTRMRFLQGKGQVNGILLSSLNRRTLRDGSVPMFVRKQLQNDFLFQRRQQAPHWTYAMNTQDVNQKIHLPLDLGGNKNTDILEQAIKDASEIPAKTDTSRHPPSATKP